MEKELLKLSIDELTPYENNPRFNNDAVDAVAESIKQCEYIAPIIIDEDNVILAGHTRLKALRRLGKDQVDVLRVSGLTEEQKKKYRLLDNKTNEFADWDFEMLDKELAELDFDGFDFDFELPDFNDKISEKSNEERAREFEERMAAGEDLEEDEEYLEFLEKFKSKKTTDDCYTPDNVYSAVKDWALNEYGLNGRPIVRPFYPGGDYQAETYPKNCVVLDNPPFSILAEIVRFYKGKGIDFFLFGPARTIFAAKNVPEVNYVCCGVDVRYDNGALVPTSFITSLGDHKITTAPDLFKKVNAANDENLAAARTALPKYEYPPEVVTSAKMNYLSAHGELLFFDEHELFQISALDAQKEKGKAIFGSGYLVSEKAAAEKAAAEKAAAEKAAAEKAAAEKWQLSERERQIIATLG